MMSDSIDQNTLSPNDSFFRCEELCNESFSIPKIFLNNLPIESANCDTESDPSRKLDNISFLSNFDCESSSAPVKLDKMHLNHDDSNDSCSIDTKSSAYFSDTSHFVCKSHADGYEFEQSWLTASMNSSGYQGSLYKLRDTLDDCDFRRKSPKLDLKEPSTPKQRDQLAKRLGIDEHFSRSAADPATACETEMMDEELMTSMSKLVTSSPMDIDDMRAANNGDSNDSANDDTDVEPVDLNNTLERVNYILAKGGFKTPSPTRMVQRKRLINEYVSNLFKQELSNQIVPAASEKSATRKTPRKFFESPKSRKPIKRTISVDKYVVG